jgi:hypothetical protein
VSSGGLITCGLCLRTKRWMRRGCSKTRERALWATGHRLTLDAPAWRPGVDESLIRRQLELSPAERIRGIETMYAQMQKLAQAGARSRGEQP